MKEEKDFVIPNTLASDFNWATEGGSPESEAVWDRFTLKPKDEKEMNLYRITLDEGEEDFYVIAKTKYDALGYLLKSGKVGKDESILNRLQFWEEAKVREGVVL